MHSFLKLVGPIVLLLFGLWSCSLEDVAPHKQVNVVDPLPLAKEYYELEKPRQVNSSFRILAEHEIFPFWAGARTLAAQRAVIPQELLMPKMPAWTMELVQEGMGKKFRLSKTLVLKKQLQIVFMKNYYQ